MTDEQRRNLLKSAYETIDEIDLSKPLTPNAYMLLGASYAILHHGEPASISADTGMPGGPSVNHDVEDELDDAEKYLKRYVDTMDADYLQMAFDETTHAMKFIKAMPDGEQRHGYMARHDQIVDRIKMHGIAI